MKDKFILSTERFSNAPSVEYFKQIKLENKTKFLLNEDFITNINLSDLANKEREESFKYRLIGSINYLSLLNNIKSDYSDIKDFFYRYDGGNNPKNIFNSFKIYLLKKSDSYTSLGNNLYKERYEIISELKDINLYNCGFSKNIFNEQTYLFNYNIDIDVKDQVDYFNKPITELYLYFDYQLETSKGEVLLSKDYNNLSNETKFITVTRTSNEEYELNDLIISNLVKRGDQDFDEIIVNEQEYRIRYSFNGNQLQFRYNPFIKIKLRDYNDTLYYGNINGNTKNIINIPSYAKFVGDPNLGNVIWKEILPHGFIDPISGLGVNFPFINNVHYVYTDNILAIRPDLTSTPTNLIFNKMNITGFENDLFILNQNPDNKC